MRINAYIAQATGLSRRAVDKAIDQGRVMVDDQTAKLGMRVNASSRVSLDGQRLRLPDQTTTILLNKPRGYVCSRRGQGSQTIYDLLPSELQELKPIGRLDKDSSGLLLLTNDGPLAHKLTHPSFKKTKTYHVTLDKKLSPLHRQMISDYGIELEDGPSQIYLERIEEYNDINWQATMHEGRNRQIRRTFAGVGYEVKKLHRLRFGGWNLPNDLKPGQYITLEVL